MKSIITKNLSIDCSSIIDINWLIGIDCHRLIDWFRPTKIINCPGWIDSETKLNSGKPNSQMHTMTEENCRFRSFYAFDLAREARSTVSESKPVHSRYSWMSQARKTAELIRIRSAVLNWFKHHTCTLHELKSLNSVQLIWSTASELGLRMVFFGKKLYSVSSLLRPKCIDHSYLNDVWKSPFVQGKLLFLLQNWGMSTWRAMLKTSQQANF